MKSRRKKWAALVDLPKIESRRLTVWAYDREEARLALRDKFPGAMCVVISEDKGTESK